VACATPAAPRPTEALIPTPSLRRAYTVLPAEEWATAELEEDMDITIAPFDPLSGAGPADQIRARFRGKDREASKTSISAATTEEFASLLDFLDSLPSDDEMLNHDPAIAKSRGSGRVQEEERNVRVPMWIYAIKYEADQDWHVIAGSDPHHGARVYYNCEVSGLPAKTAASYATLLAVRNSLDEILDHDLPGIGRSR
jgi:hypothetical protein